MIDDPYVDHSGILLNKFGITDQAPTRHKTGAAKAKQRSIELYKQFLSAQKNPISDIEERLKNVQENPKGSNE